MSPRVRPKAPSAAMTVRRRSDRKRRLSSWEEYRRLGSGDAHAMALDGENDFTESAWWHLMTARPGPGGALNVLSVAERRALSKATGPAGGHLVPADFEGQVLAAARPSRALGAIARMIETDNGQALPVPTNTAHGSGAWLAENAPVIASDETFAQVTLNAFKAATKIILSEELDADALDGFDGFLAQELGFRLALLEEAGFVAGDGAGKPLGITHLSAPYSIVTAAAGSATSLRWADYAAAVAALPAAYLATSTWILGAPAFASLVAMVDTAGAPAWDSGSGLLMGRPYVVSGDFPAAGASAKAAALGDWQRAYGVRRVTGLAMQRLEELHSDNGQVGYRLITRVDGRPTLTEAAVVLRHSAT